MKGVLDVKQAGNKIKSKKKKKKDLEAPQLATVEVTLNAFYGAPTLSPTSRSKSPKIETSWGEKTRLHRQSQSPLVSTKPPPAKTFKEESNVSNKPAGVRRQGITDNLSLF